MKHDLTIGQVAVILGEQPRTVKQMIAKGQFPAADAQAGEYPAWQFDTVEKWCELRDATPASVPRFECGPFASKARCGPVMRLLQLYGIRSRISLDLETQKYCVAIPVTGETTQRFEIDLKELMPRLKFRLIRDDSWLDLEPRTA